MKKFFFNCLALDSYDVSSTYKRERKCNKCEENFYLNSNFCAPNFKYFATFPTIYGDLLSNCLEGNSLTNCIKCQENYYLTGTPNISEICCPYNTILIDDSCLSVQEYFLNSSMSDSDRYCQSNGEIITYELNGKCCPEGKKGSDCDTDITISNCLQIDSDDDCIKCETGYFIDPSDECSNIQNCIDYNPDNSCKQCDSGYVIDDGDDTACVENVVINCFTGTNDITNAYATNLCFDKDVACADASCLYCGPNGYQYDSETTPLCCPLGYINKDDRCIKIFNKYCAKYNSDYTECEECFVDEELCIIQEGTHFSLKNGNYSDSRKSFTNFAHNYYSNIQFNYLGADTKECCPLGKYWNGSSCIDIEVENCWKYENGECILCKDQYKYDQGHCCKYHEIYDSFYQICIIDDSGINCPTDKYKSNNHCCYENYYWDLTKNRCMKLFDTKCKESDSKNTCKKCDDGYELDDSYKYTVNLNFKTLETCINPNEMFVIQFCLESLSIPQNSSYKEIRNITNNCIIPYFDDDVIRCSSCMEKSYSTTNNLCCLKGYFEYKNTCRVLEKLVENCQNYNNLTRECSKCEESYHLEKGICCPKGKFLDAVTMKCDKIDLNCKTFDVDIGICSECEETKYYTNGHCCDENYYYNLNKKTCVLISGSGLTFCEKLDDFGTCQKCSSNYYLHKGYCCEPGYFWNTYRETCQSELCEDYIHSGSATFDTDNMCDWYWNNKKDCDGNSTSCCACGTGGIILPHKTENCKYFGFLNDCIECLDNFYFNNGKCCQWETFWEADSNSCVKIFEYKGCKIYNDDKTCLSCLDNYYLSNGHCCKDTFFWNDSTKSCILINKQYNPGCSISENNDHDNCLVCQDDYYKSDEKHCCSKGKWWDPELQICQNITTSLSLCDKTSDNVNCDECSEASKIAFKYACSSPDCDEYIFTCQSRTDVIFSSDYTNCLKAEGDINTSAFEAKCKLCESGYWAGVDGHCCSEGQKWDSSSNGGECVTLTGFDDCLVLDITESTCVKCVSTHYLNSGVCLLLGTGGATAEYYHTTNGVSACTVPNCYKGVTGTNPAVCESCILAFKLDSGGTGCTADSDCAKDENDNCTLCTDPTKYPTHGACCLKEKVYQSSTCITFDKYERQLSTDCLEMDNEKCIKCSSGTYLSHNGRCCDIGKYDNQTSCVSKTGEGLVNCKKYANSTLCKMNTPDTEMNPTQRLDSCENSHYFHNNHCCPEEKYWDETKNSCELISSINNYNNCQQVNEENLCIKCSNTYYVTNGFCCLNGFFKKKNDSCVEIIRDSCTQRSNTKCLLCSSGSVDSIHDQCCDSQYFSTINKICVDKPENCKDVDGNGDCMNCDSNFYLTNKRCCAQNSHWNGTTCFSNSSIEHCLEIADYDTSNPSIIIQCSLCTDQKKVRNGQCCLKDELFFLDKGCIKANLIIGPCLELNGDGTCKKCKSDFYSSSGVCCPENTFFKDLKCESINNTDYPNCKEISNEECILCESTYYLNSFIVPKKKCCKIGTPHLENKSDCDEPLVEDCIKFSEFLKKCLECKSDFNVYVSLGEPDSDGNQLEFYHCCPDGKFWNSILNECDKIEQKPLNCAKFSLKEMMCLDCKPNYNLYSGNCCANGSYWNDDESKCLPITYPNCSKQNITECIECESDYYLANKGCCKIKNHWNDDESKCFPNSDELCYEFDLSTEKCKKCYGNFVWHDDSCQRKIKNCEQYERINGELKCKKCFPSFELSEDEVSCCEKGTFFVSDAPYERQCVFNPLIDRFLITCLEYDYETFNCKECGKDYYVSNGICCPHGKYKITDKSYLCEDIPTVDCIEYNGSSCTKCNDRFKLKNDSCVAIPEFCIKEEYNILTSTCEGCELGKYVTNNNCCDKGKWWNSSTCEIIDSTQNCLEKQTDSICLNCKEEFYLKNNICCPNSKFCPNADRTDDVDGNIKNCQKYGTSSDNCIFCDDSYSLVTLKSDIKYCFPIPKQKNCSKNTITVNSENNLLSCSACKDQTFLQNNSSILPFYEHYYHKYENCVGFENDYLLDNSTLKCLACADGYFINESDVCETRSSGLHCTIYNLTADECKQCEEKYWFDPTTKTCKLHDSPPNQKCEFYNGVECEVCKANNGSGKDYWRIFDSSDPTWPSCELSFDDDLADDPSYWPGYIYKCRENFECSDEYLNGLSIKLEKFISCHKCHESTKIPFVALRIDDSTNTLEGLQKYQVTLDNSINLNDFNDDNVNFSNQCFKSDLSDFGLVDSANNNFPTNCAIGIINSTLKADTTESNSNSPSANKLGIYCGACKPGFKPTVSTPKVFYVEECVAIDNCELSGTAFNQCDKCVDEFAFDYTTANGIDRSTCIGVSSNKHCYTFNSENNKCIICKKGYSLNLENVCELLDAPYCKNKKIAKNQFLDKRDYELIVFRGIVGCQDCSPGFSGIFKTETEFVCTDSPYLKKGNFIINNPAFNQNCLQYGLNSSNEIYCHKCKKDFVVTIKSNDLNNVYGRCLAKTGSLKYCSQVDNSSVCVLCDDTHVLVNSQCVIKDISNCKTYSNIAITLTCTACNNYYYLSSNECLIGNITDCLVYSAKNSCSQCKVGYQRIDTKDGQHYCIPVTNHKNCVDFKDSDFQNLKLTCSQCESGFLLQTIIDTNDYKTVCNRIQLIPFCSKYDRQLTFETSTFNCLACHQEYFLTNNSCQKRLLKLKNCLTYSIISDTCVACESDYYLNETDTECLINPFGITGCAIFSDDDVCLACKSLYYIENNKCLIVPTDNLIIDCIQYSDSKTCSTCVAEKALDDNQCKEPEVQNCDVYSSVKSCFRCTKGYGLKSSGDLNSCEVLPSISNCNTVTTEYPFECSECLDGYYLETDSSTNVLGCKVATPIIENCKEYSAKDQCLRCNENYVVSADNKSCFIFKTNTRCLSYKEQENPFCVLCVPGYKLNSKRDCVTLSIDPKKGILSNPGCLLFDFYDSSICKICKPKFYMDKKGMCIEVLTDEEKEQMTNSTDAVPEGVPDPNKQKYIDIVFAKFGVLILAVLSFLG